MPVIAAAAVVAAAALDRGFAEPPARVCPVALLGRLVSPVDRERSYLTLVGTVAAVALPVLAAGVTATVTWVATLVPPWLGAAVTVFALFPIMSFRILFDAATVIVLATADESSLDTARYELRALAGRDPLSLSVAGVRSAAVESVAENLADGLVAPLLASMLFAAVSLPLAVGAVARVKGTNTLNSMLGYRYEPVGRVPARPDDTVMWFPARVSAILLAVVAGMSATVARVGELARHPSPSNSGWPMVTLVVLLETRLEKPGYYLLDGGPEAPDAATVTRGVRLVSRTGLAASVVAGVVAWL